jgi:hypothetical protein
MLVLASLRDANSRLRYTEGVASAQPPATCLNPYGMKNKSAIGNLKSPINPPTSINWLCEVGETIEGNCCTF